MAPLVQLGPSQPGVTVGLNQAGHECILSLVPDGGQVTFGDGEGRRLGHRNHRLTLSVSLRQGCRLLHILVTFKCMILMFLLRQVYFGIMYKQKCGYRKLFGQ